MLQGVTGFGLERPEDGANGGAGLGGDVAISHALHQGPDRDSTIALAAAVMLRQVAATTFATNPWATRVGPKFASRNGEVGISVSRAERGPPSLEIDGLDGRSGSADAAVAFSFVLPDAA
jgi:hypothetical protein